MNKFWVLTNLIQNSNVYPIPKVEHPHHQQSDQQQHPQQQQPHQQPPPSHQPASSTTSSKGGGSRHPANHAIGPAAPGIYHNPSGVPGPTAPGASSAPTVPTSAIGSPHLTNLSGPAAANAHSGRGSTGHAPAPPGAHLQLNGTVSSDHTKAQYLGNMQVHPAHATSGHHAPPTATQGGPPQSAHPPQPISIVKPEFKVPSIPTHLMDVRGPDGSIVKINMPEHHDPSKPPNNVEMLKVNIEDLSQFLSYHEVFGKLPSDMLTGPSASLVPSSATNTASTSGGHSNGKRECRVLSFTRKEHLTNHVRQHTGESPYRCPYCGKTFTRKEHLTNHVR
ncbi:conserved hypothetical protein [Culex quinquefasciatus]|uniref:C2H2-type domain-containing protein n=1 Tax=Culex quinquefasciatus TaxID=7176 RepID=B0WI68_CULQU|nr:conserved hypothetical protein [Culex quinquefasciatus]|eukprot:XP_001848402.1 conserved hypothetical protein [Culex quinquefasciatus]